MLASSQPGTRRVVVELPEPVLRFLASTPSEAAARLRELALIDLVRCGEVSSAWAAEQLGTSQDEFRRLLAEHGVPSIDLSAEELRLQVEAAMPRQDGEAISPSPTRAR